MAERSGFQPDQGTIRWRLHFKSRPERVFDHLATDGGRATFWAESTETRDDGSLVFHLLNEPRRIDARVIEDVRPRRYAVTYFAGSTAEFDLVPDGSGGTDLLLTANRVEEAFRMEMSAGWATVLMALKAAVEFGVDLRNHDERRTWDHGFVDD